MSHSAAAIDFADSVLEDAEKALQMGLLSFEQWVMLQRQWSKFVFGSRADRGPAGPVKHLKKEVDEVLDSIHDAEYVQGEVSHAIKVGDAGLRDHHIGRLAVRRESLLEELADCLFLVFDACWRADFGPTDIRRMLTAKLVANRSRTWQTPSSPDEPVEHVRE